MLLEKYLIITRTRGDKLSARLAERYPSITGNEIAVKILLDIPKKFFECPVLEAKISIPKDAIPKTKITPTIVSNIEKIVKEATGLNIAVSLVEIEEQK